MREASLEKKRFGTYNKDGDFYTFNDKFVIVFIRKSIKVGRVANFNRYFEWNQSEVILNTLKKHLEKNNIEDSNIIKEYLKYINIKRDELKLEFEKDGKDYRKTNKKEMEKFLGEKLGELENS